MYPSGDGRPVSNEVDQGVPPLRVVFFGMRCAASGPPLAALLIAGVDVRAVVLPASLAAPPVRQLPPVSSMSDPQVSLHAATVACEDLSQCRGRGHVAPTPGRRGRDEADIVHLAQGAGIPILEIASLKHPAALATVAALCPDVIVTACFPRRLPVALLAVPSLGGVNVHPSLLPVGRGPEPVFWTLRRGERRTGATVHQMDAAFDAGPILAQEAINVPSGIRALELDLSLARLGARLLVPAVRALATGHAEPRPQDDVLATYAPIPTAVDYIVPTNLPARWAYTFVRGVAPLGGPLLLHVLATGERFSLLDALAYTESESMERPLVRMGTDILVRFRPGTVRYRLA